MNAAEGALADVLAQVADLQAQVDVLADARARDMARLRGMIGRLGQSMAPVAILGESGSGKELVARAIHAMSARRGRPFVAVN